jgi:hypothetical protein
MDEQFQRSEAHSSEENYLRLVLTTMRYNLIWYLPLCLWILFYIIIPNIGSGYHNLKIVFHRFTWAIFFSPSAYLFLVALFASVFLPVRLLGWIPIFFAKDAENTTYKRRYLWSLLLTVGIFITAILIQVLIWDRFRLK